MVESSQTNVWEANSGQWNRVGAPLRPTRDDAVLTMAALKPVFATASTFCRVAVLGVTPELITLPWPPFVVIDAFDHSADMIKTVWQPSPFVLSSVHESDWRKLPVDSQAISAVVGDGSLNALPAIEGYGQVFSEMDRVLKNDGRIVLRCFVKPDVPEAIKTIVEDVFGEKVGSFHALKWRIAMSLVSDSSASVAVSDIFETFEQYFPSRAELAHETGWPQGVIDTIDSYRGSPTRYTFPCMGQLVQSCLPWFEVTSVEAGTYELAERCPTMTFVRRAVG